MKTIYANAEEKFVKGVILFADEDGNLYFDCDYSGESPVFTNPVTGKELFDLFIKNLITIYNETDGYLKPTAATGPDEHGYATVTVFTSSLVSTTVPPAINVYYSDEQGE